MHRQHGYFVLNLQPECLRLALRRFHRDYHVSQGFLRRNVMGNRVRSVGDIALGKGENIGGLVLPAVVAVQPMDGRVVREEDADFCALRALSAKDCADGL